MASQLYETVLVINYGQLQLGNVVETTTELQRCLKLTALYSPLDGHVTVM